MAETKKTQGIELEKYAFYVPEDPKSAKDMEAKAWNHRKLKKVITNDYILSYQEIQEMKYVFESQLENAERDLEILEQDKISLKEKIEGYKAKVKEWKEELAHAERDVPEIGERAAKERADDELKKAKHEANLRGEGKGKAFEMNSETGDLEDNTGTKI